MIYGVGSSRGRGGGKTTPRSDDVKGQIGQGGGGRTTPRSVDVKGQMGQGLQGEQGLYYP